MKTRKSRYFVGDFETTVYPGQETTEVWASAVVELNTEEVNIFHSIDETWNYISKLKDNIIIYYHNLKFDGSFWIDFFLRLGMKQAFKRITDTCYEPVPQKDMVNNTFKYSISGKGQWYTIIIKTRGHYIEMRDSLKLLPFSVAAIGKAFHTKHQKLSMEYAGFRFPGCEITDEERRYIANDVLVVKEAIELMFDDGHTALTIGACCMEEYKKMIGKDDFQMFFPNMKEYEIPKEIYGNSTADEYIRKSYKGGWCYVRDGYQGQIQGSGCTADVNSLYSSVMHSESGNYYPVGKPKFWTGDYIPEDAKLPKRYFFIRIRTEFYLKEGKLPFIQIKGNPLYRGNDCLRTSDYKGKDGTYSRYYTDYTGKVKITNVELTLTMTDYYLMLEHYHLVNTVILSGCWFYAEKGLFDMYINKYAEIKMNSKGAKRTEAKLFLNNLYGKLATSDDSSFKMCYLNEKTDAVSFVTVEEHNKKVVYIPIGSAITSYARHFTITAAQKNYEYFRYADTDSVHCTCSPDKLVGVPIHPTKFCHWKLETEWSEAIFTRQKTYIEKVTIEDGEPVEPYYNIKCAGMPDKCKKLLNASITGEEYETEEEEEKEFLSQRRTLDDFKVGLKVPGKLQPVRIKGGTLLCETTYEMR